MIKRDLIKAGAIGRNTLEIFHLGARDSSSAKFLRCSSTGSIILPDYYVGKEEYTKKQHRETISWLVGDAVFERNRDNSRREKTLTKYYENKKVLDFGCGLGDFARRVKQRSTDVSVYDLDLRRVECLSHEGFKGVFEINDLSNDSFDTIFLFHVLEHIVEPLKVLVSLHAKLKVGGNIVIEVPHANDLLLHLPHLSEFKNFSLWTQHVALYSEYSLKRLLRHVGFSVSETLFIQRYNYYNHLKWFIEKRPGGHKDSKYTNLGFGEKFLAQYENFLKGRKQTDTILIVGEKYAKNL